MAIHDFIFCFIVLDVTLRLSGVFAFLTFEWRATRRDFLRMLENDIAARKPKRLVFRQGDLALSCGNAQDVEQAMKEIISFAEFRR